MTTYSHKSLTAPRKERNTTIEMLRFLFMFCICLRHLLFYGYGYNDDIKPTDIPLQHELTKILTGIGVSGFMYISGYYGIRPSFRGG